MSEQITELEQHGLEGRTLRLRCLQMATEMVNSGALLPDDVLTTADRMADYVATGSEVSRLVLKLAKEVSPPRAGC